MASEEVISSVDAAVLGRQLRRWRESAGLSQERFALKCGLSVRTIRNVEGGRRRPHEATLGRLLDALPLDETARQQIEQALREGTAEQQPTSSRAPDSRSTGVPPAQLPADVRAFTGRKADLCALDAALVPSAGSSMSEPTEQAQGTPIVAVVGMAGAGKTSLAVHWAHRAQAHWPDGQLFVDLCGYDPRSRVDAVDALAQLLRGLGVPEQEWPVTLHERAARYRSELARRRVLVLLDNAWSVDQIRPLLPGWSECAVIVTSRDALAGLVVRDGARRIPIGPLPADDAVSLLQNLLGEREAGAESLAPLADLCDRLPLALRVAAEQVQRRPETTLEELVEDLRHHPDPLSRLRQPADERGSRVVPAQLPVAVAGFAGRAAQVAVLDAAASVGVGSRPVTVVISAVSGTAGVGKTALAIHWAHRVRDRFPDGQLYVNLRGFDPGGAVMAPVEAVRLFLDALGVPAERIPADLDARAGLYRSLLAGRRMLVVLDNARDAEQVRPLLPGAPGCVVVVTSRSDLSGLVAGAGAQPLCLDLLTGSESWQLLAARLGEDRLTAEPEAVEQIVTSCARLPLALAIVAARAAAHPHFPLAALAAELRDPAERLDALAGAGPAGDLRALFSWSYRALSPPAARLFRLLGLHPGPDISAAAAASLAGLPPPQVRSLLAELAAAHLIVEHRPHRYTFHDLLRTYAEEQAHASDSADDGRDGVHRLLDHYVHTAYAADRLLDPAREPIVPVDPRAGVTPERPADNTSARAWFSSEHAVLLSAVDRAMSAGFHAHAWQLAWSLVDFLDWQGHWRDYLATQCAALTAAERLGDLAGQALSHRHLARAHARLGSIDEAHLQLQHALELYGKVGDQVGQADAHLSLALILERRRRYAEALHHSRLALDLYEQAGSRRGQALALNACGWYQARLGDHSQALLSCQQALSLFHELGDDWNAAGAWDSVGYAHHHLGHHGEAAACYRRAVTLYREHGDRYLEADTLTHLGDTAHAAADAGAACDAWREALTILDELGHSDADDVRAKLRDLGTE